MTEKALVKGLNRNMSIDTQKDIDAIRKDDLEALVLQDVDIGYEFTLITDTRASSVSQGGLRSRYKPGIYKVIGIYPHYILAERTDVEAKEKSEMYVESTLFTRPKYISKESFTYMEMYLIATGQHPGLEQNIEIKEDLPKGWKKK